MKINWKNWKVLAPLLVLSILLLAVAYFIFGGEEYVGPPIGVHPSATTSASKKCPEKPADLGREFTECINGQWCTKINGPYRICSNGLSQ
jgi:hypothetical protein